MSFGLRSRPRHLWSLLGEGNALELIPFLWDSLRSLAAASSVIGGEPPSFTK